MRPRDFIQMIAAGAQEFQAESGIRASVTIAQAALETGWGSFVPVDDVTGQVSYNLFGIKGEGPAGSVRCSTWEVSGGEEIQVKAQFRAYHSFTESLRDHSAVLLQPRYTRVREAETVGEACRALYVCGYATDPDYPAKLEAIITQYDLTQYDRGEYLMTKADADKLIQLLSAVWFMVESNDAREEIHRLANELRKASGQKEE